MNIDNGQRMSYQSLFLKDSKNLTIPTLPSFYRSFELLIRQNKDLVFSVPPAVLWLLLGSMILQNKLF